LSKNITRVEVSVSIEVFIFVSMLASNKMT